MKHLLMLVYNPLQFDGRAQRAASALSNDFNVSILSLKCDAKFQIPGIKIFSYSPKISRLSLIEFWFRSILLALKLKPDVLYTHDYYLCLPGRFASLLSRTIWMHDMHEIIFSKGKMKLNYLSLRNSFFVCIEKLTLGKANAIIVPNYFRSRLVKKFFRLKDDPIVVHNIIDNKELNPRNQEKKLNVSKIKVVYQGYISKNRDLKSYIDAFKELNSKYSLTLIGSGPDLEYFKNYVIDNNLQNKVIFLKKMSRTELYDHLTNYNFGLVVYKFNSLNNLYCAPNKIYEYSFNYLPILASGQLPIKSIIKDYKIGYIIKSHVNTSSKEIAIKIQNSINNYNNYLTQISLFNLTNNWPTEEKAFKKKVLWSFNNHNS